MQHFQNLKIVFSSSSSDFDIYDCTVDGMEFRVIVYFLNDCIVKHDISFSDRSCFDNLPSFIRKSVVRLILRGYDG